MYMVTGYGQQVTWPGNLVLRFSAAVMDIPDVRGASLIRAI